MPMQAKAEGVKLFHAKAQLWALLGFVLVLLWFANSGTMYFMVAGDLLNPLDSIGFFKDVAMGSGRSGLQLVRSSQSLTVFSWLIPVNLCVAQFASERRARTDELFVSHGGRLSTLYSAKFGVVCGFCLLLQLAFYGICFIITAIQMGIAPALGTVLLFCAVSVGNLLVLGAFLALASVLTLWLKNHAAAALVTSILPLAGVLLYQVQYEDFSTQPFLIQLAAKAMPTYYWSRLCALNITPQFCVEFVAWVIVALAVAAGLGWMALHRPDAGKQRSARKAHAVLRRREKSAARQGMHRASTFSAALYALRCTRLPGMLALFSLLCMAFALGVSESRIVDATWADGRRVGIFPGGSLPVGSAADAALGTVLSVGILAWIAVILVVVMAFHQNKTAGAAGWRSPWRKPGPIYGWKFCGGNDYAPRVVHGCCISCCRCSREPSPSRDARRFSGCRAPGFCRQAMRWFGWYADFAAVNCGGYFLLCGDSGWSHCERFCPGSGGSFSLVRAIVLCNTYALLAGSGRGVFDSLGRLLVMAQVLPPCAWRQRWLSRQ